MASLMSGLNHHHFPPTNQHLFVSFPAVPDKLFGQKEATVVHEIVHSFYSY